MAFVGGLFLAIENPAVGGAYAVVVFNALIEEGLDALAFRLCFHNQERWSDKVAIALGNENVTSGISFSEPLTMVHS